MSLECSVSISLRKTFKCWWDILDCKWDRIQIYSPGFVMYYVNCRMCWVQLSGTQRLPVAFAVVLFLNLNLNLFQCQAECRENPADRTLTGAACQSGRGRCGKWRGAVSRESSRLRRIFVLKAGKPVLLFDQRGNGAWRHLTPPPDLHSQGSHCLFLPSLPPAFDVKPSRFAISTQTGFQNIPSLPCSWFLFKMVMIILFWNINGSTFGGGGGGICNSHFPAWLH